ncbi:MAG: DUF3810 domain-containing protein [Planctomycetota bacterium]
MVRESGGNGDRDRPVRWRASLVLLSLGPLSYGLLLVAGHWPEHTERFFARGLHPLLVRVVSAPWRFLPFSAAEALLLSMAAALAWRTTRALLGWRAGRRTPRNLAGHALAQVLGALGLSLAAFELLFGLNHARLPFAVTAGLTVRPTDAARISEMAGLLALQAAAERALIPADVEYPFRLSEKGDADARLVAAWARATQRYPALAGAPPLVRISNFSPLLSAAGLTGVYSPFTGEAHVNHQTPAPTLPFAACHEVAHLRGFAREDEANFIAFLVCRYADDPAWRYSGTLTALIHVLNALARAAPERWLEIREELPQGLRADIDRVHDFWRRRRSALTTLVEHTNHRYLRSQGQAAGLASYGRVVDLLAAYLPSTSR